MCVATKKHMDRRGIEYTEIDVSKDTDSLDHIVSLGYKQVPVVEVDDTHWSGYNQEKIEALAS